MSLDTNLLGRVYHREEAVINSINESVVRAVLPALAAVIQSEALKISAKYSPTEADPFSRDALQSLILGQVASFLTFDDIDQVEIIAPHQLAIPSYAEFFFDVQPMSKL